MKDQSDKPNHKPAAPGASRDSEEEKYSYHRMMAGSGAPRAEMTRGQQTAWIVGTIIAIFLIIVGYFAFFQEDPRYPGCSAFFGKAVSGECTANIAASRLMRGF